MNDENNGQSALQLFRRTPHPAAHAVLGGIVLTMVSLVGWAALSEVDVVTVAPGTVIPQSKSKPVQAAARGIVSEVRVAEGDRVLAGDALVELDPQDARNGLNQLAERYRTERNGWLINRAYLNAMDSNQLHRQSVAVLARKELGALIESVDYEYAIALQQRLEARLAAYRHRLQAEHAKQAALAREQRALESRLKFVEFDVPRAKESLASYLDLYEQQLVSRERYLRAEREHAERVQRLEAMRAEQQGLLEQQRELEQSLHSYIAAEHAGAAEAAARHEAAFRELELQMQQSRLQLNRLTVRAPIDGVVQQVAVRGPGMVVERGEVLMLIVPEHAVLEVDASIANRDIGFVREGQLSAVKIDAYRFTRYGFVEGTVRTVSAEAIAGREGTPRYAARIALDVPALEAGGQSLALAPGMAVSVEIATGQRTVLDYFLSPVRAAMHQSIRER